MIIKRVIVKNFRNLDYVNVPLSKVTTVIGRNNSGKSNFLRAVTLPLLSEDLGSGSKSLSWSDIGSKSVDRYLKFIVDNRGKFGDGSVNLEEFEKVTPIVSVQIHFYPKETELFLVKDLITSNGENTSENDFEYMLEYNFGCKNIVELRKHVASILVNLKDDEALEEFKYNLLPINMFSYSIFIPYKNQKVSFDTLKKFLYNSISAERDDFSQTNSRLGSKSLVQILNNKLQPEDNMEIERRYSDFFNSIQDLTKMDEVLNWQEVSFIENAEDFFSKISILPNMPPMSSLLGSIKLGYEDRSLSSQGLGNRNLILQMVLINSLMQMTDAFLNVLTVEEPEAHLCYNNERLMSAYINSLGKSKENLQLIYSTHSVQQINKTNLENLILFENGTAKSFQDTFEQIELNYLAKNPNFDIFKLFYSQNCILVEGISEELLIRSYLSREKNKIQNIEVISFHKGFRDIMDIWLLVNKDTENKLGIIRDSDFQPKAQSEHEEYNNYSNIYVTTTKDYTLEDDIVSRENNFSILKKYFETNYEWENIDTPDKLSEKWKSSKADVMLKFCQNLDSDDLCNIEMPNHIDKVIKWLLGADKD